MYTTIRELGPKIPYYRRNYGSQFPNSCIYGPSGFGMVLEHGHVGDFRPRNGSLDVFLFGEYTDFGVRV